MRQLISTVTAVLLVAAPPGAQPLAPTADCIEVRTGSGSATTLLVGGGYGPNTRAGPFARAGLVLGGPAARTLVSADTRVDATRSLEVKSVTVGGGLAFRALMGVPGLEVRLGTAHRYDRRRGDWDSGLVGQVCYVY